MAKRYKVNKEEYSKVLDNNMAFLKLSFMPVGFVITFFGFLFTITGVKVQDLNFDSNFIFEIIRNINSDIYALEFLEMISYWARKHSKEIIAEFVENYQIQKIVEQNDIRFSQGYLYSKPTQMF